MKKINYQSVCIGMRAVCAMFINIKSAYSMMRWIGSLVMALAFAICAFGTVSAKTITLTGATVYAVDQKGEYTGNGWDTVGPNWVHNLYLLTESYMFLNAGNGAATSPNINLCVPGTHTFLLRADGSGFNWPTSFAGLNLYFNNSTSPGISASAAFNVSIPALTPLSNYGLGIPHGQVSLGANSLSFMVDNSKVTLTAFNWIDFRNPVVAPLNPDLTRAVDNTADGLNDYTGMITLQVAPENMSLRNVRIVKTISNVNIDVDQASFTKQPFSITDVGNQKLIEWRFDTYASNAADDLGFDIILKNPVPNEKRLVSYKTTMSYDDTCGNPVTAELEPQYITVHASTFQIAPAIDKQVYAANEVVQISSTVKNLSSVIGNGAVKVSIRDTSNVLVAELGSTSTQSIAAGGVGVFSGVNFSTGNTYAGNYKVVAEVIDTAGIVVGSGSTPFTIKAAAGTGAKVSMTTDKQQYTLAETVRISAQLSNTQSNAALDNVQVVTTVTNPDGSVRFSKTETLAQLPASNTKNYAYSLPLTGAAPGQYGVKIVATSGANSVQANGSFVVTSSSSNGSGLTGSVTVNPTQVAAGSALTLNFSANNQGNSALANQALSVNIIDPTSQKVLAQFPYTSTIVIGGTYSGSTSWTATVNTGGSYVATLTATFGANTVTLAQANFTVSAPQFKLNTVIDTDKTSYAPTDIVKLHERLTNTTVNQAANNLQVVVTVKNPDGSTRFTKTETLASLAINGVQDYNHSISLSAAPAGQYTTSVVVSIAGSTVISQANGVFTVTSTANTGSGLKGSITASASQVSVGNLISFPFSVTNEGNAALADLPLTVSITDATQKVITSFPYKTTLPMAGMFVGNTDWTSAGTADAQYTAVLSAKVGSNTLTLGQVTFTLTSSVVSLSIKQAATPWQNVLVYSACKRAADELLGKCAATKFPAENAATLAQCDAGRASLLDTTLANQGISHTISTDAATFLTQLRSGNYSTYWISNGASALPEPAASELLAAIKRGQGFMLDSLVSATNPQLAQCSGVANNGAYATALQQLSLAGGIYNGGDLAGPATQTKLATAGGTVEATLKGTATSPGIVSANYGNGKTLAFGFDWSDTLKAQSNENRWPTMIKQGLDYLTPAAADLNALLPGDISTLTSTITNTGASQPVRIVQSLPAGSVIKATTPAAIVSNNGSDVIATWDLTAATAADTVVSVRWQAPVYAGTYNANLAVSMVSGANATPYKSQDQAIKVQSASQIHAQTITLIQGLSLSTPAQLAQRTAIVDLLNQVNGAMSSSNMDKALRLLITVQAKLKNIETGVGPASKSLANLIAVVERQIGR